MRDPNTGELRYTGQLERNELRDFPRDIRAVAVPIPIESNSPRSIRGHRRLFALSFFKRSMPP